MQNEVPPLPIVCSDEHKRSSRPLTKEFESDSATEKINHSQCKSTQFLQSNRKQLKPIGGPYKNNMRAHGVPQSTKMPNKNSGIGQRIISAKMLRMKELQNQLTDAHYHLNELANENKLLRALQKRQDSALRRYEGTNAELPRIINSHHEELKAINNKYKQLKAQHRYTCDLLKEKENEIHSLQSRNKHLLKLSKDQHLEEREKLQMQVSDLNHQIQQQHETIQILNRKLTLESKRLKHQITTEAAKHKETKKKLQEALEKLKNAEQMLASKEKQLYNGRLPAFNKRKKIASQSLTNLQDNSFTSNFINPSSSSSKDFQSELTKNSLPKLPGSDPDESRITIPKPNSSENARRSETMTSLEQIRNFRLPKSGHSRRSSISGRSSHERAQELDTKLDNQSHFIAKSSRSSSLHNFNNNADTLESEEDEEIKNITQGLTKKTINSKYHIPNELMREAGYSFSDNDTDDEEIKEEKLISPTSRSRSLHAKLINGYISSPNAAEENVSSGLNEPKEEIKNHQSITNNKKVNNVINNDNLNTDNGSDDKVGDIESEEIEEEIQINNEDDACNISSSKSDMKIEDTKKNNNEDVLTGSKSWTVLQEKNKEEQKFDDLLFDFKKIDLKQKPPNNDSSKIIDDGDELMQYFDKNRYTDVENNQSDHKQSEQINLLKPVCNGDLKIEEDEVVDKSNECKDIKDQEIKSKRSEKKEKTSNSPKQDSANGSQDKVSNKKITNFNKQKLLAAIKAIDDNENIEYLPKKKSLESASRSQVTENLYRGLPTHTKRREDIIKDIFGPTKVETKLQSGCSKLH